MYLFILCVWCFVCIYICLSHEYLMPMEARHQIPWVRSYRWLLATMWVLGIKSQVL